MKEIWVKDIPQKWFDVKIADEIKNRDGLFKEIKKSKLHNQNQI